MCGGSVPARTLDALKRRLWVTAGPCQGSLCLAELTALLARELGVDPAEVAAFGDMPNDLPMLAWAGHGYAIAEGHPSLVGAGFRLTEGPQDEAVGRVIMQLLG